MQPIHLTFDQQRIRELLPDRLEWAYVWRTLHELGTPLAFGSDTPVASPDVLAGLRAATERQGSDGAVFGPNERLGVTEALAAYTRGAAYAIAREHRSGQLSPGYDADLVVLSHDPRQDLTELAVEGTLLAGRWTYRAMRDG
jgi:predicted amidohydrolase YtcJ